MRREVHDKAPIVSAELPETGERFEGVMPPVSPAPCFAMRKPADVLYRLADYVAARIMSVRQAEVLAISGARAQEHPGGRRHLVGQDHPGQRPAGRDRRLGERVVILEDTRELKCAAADCVALRTKPGVATLADLVRSTLRLRPDRIIVGEVRGAEALDMLKAWNTGHPGGITTVHANSAPAGALPPGAAGPGGRRHRAARPDRRRRSTSSSSSTAAAPTAGVETLLEVAGLDADGDYLLKPLGRPTLHTV